LEVDSDRITVRLVSRHRALINNNIVIRVLGRLCAVTDANLVGGIGCLFCDAPGEDCSNAAGKSLQDVAS